MRFAGKWRDYQQRVIDEFERLICDDRIHVVAAPGSGKTILGLELIRRIGRPAIVLAPTVAVRNQWIERLVPMFLREKPTAAEASTHLVRSSTLTCATYQALYALWSDPDPSRFTQFVEQPSAAGPVTLLLDECHHLRREWWHALQTLIDRLPGVTVVALTATPPYDAPYAEWIRYQKACGPIDLEIGVPELVRNGDLCPHQDYVHFSEPEQPTIDLLQRRRDTIGELLRAIRSDEQLIDDLLRHPWLVVPEAHVEAILDAPELLSAILVLIASSSRPLPAAPLKLLGVRADELPVASAFWTATLLDAILFSHSEIFPAAAERLKSWKPFLAEHGLIEGQHVCLGETRSTFSLMAGSIAKLGSIVDIARAEFANLGTDLRLVILTDHVRTDEFPRSFTPNYRPSKIGVVPIFDALRRSSINGLRIAVLSGKLVLIPTDAAAALVGACEKRGLSPAVVRRTSLPGLASIVQLDFEGAADGCAVEIITDLFEAGHINVLVGTQALLGEGWDAPSVNSLVLASNSAAYMLSNQMRGRAIRIDPERPAKVSNIWHLATVDQLAPVEIADRFEWGSMNEPTLIRSDWELLQRRFAAFEGIPNHGDPNIRSGFERLGMDGNDIEAANRATLALAADRPAIARRWHQAIGAATLRSHVREIAQANYDPRHLSWRDTLRWLAASGASGGAMVAAHEGLRVAPSSDTAHLAAAVAIAFGIYAFPRFAKASWLAIRHRTLESSVAEVGKVVLSGLAEADQFSFGDIETAKVIGVRNLSGEVDIYVDGLNRAEERMVLDAVGEVLGPVANPRYLLERRSGWGPWRRLDYHAVPASIAQRKEWAEAFHRLWKRHVGPSTLLFTRTVDGRRALLRARGQSLAAGFQRRVDRRSAWM